MDNPKRKMPRLLVTGASGFLGSAIVEEAQRLGIPVTPTDRKEGSKSPGIKIIPWDIRASPSVSGIFENIDCVCHVAGLAHVFGRRKGLEGEFHSLNVLGSENVARAAIQAGVKRLVFISSVSVYGGVSQGKNEKAECLPEGPYAESKLEGERCLTELCQEKGVSLSILRLATLYGEGDPGNVARLMGSIARGRFLWVGSGKNLKSLLYREDAARACIEVAKNPLTGNHIFNVSAPPVKMKDIVETIGDSLGKTLFPWHIPTGLALKLAKVMQKISFNRGPLSRIHETLQKWVADDYYETDKFLQAFNFEIKMGLKEGIRREAEWYMKRVGR